MALVGKCYDCAFDILAIVANRSQIKAYKNKRRTGTEIEQRTEGTVAGRYLFFGAARWSVCWIKIVIKKHQLCLVPSKLEEGVKLREMGSVSPSANRPAI